MSPGLPVREFVKEATVSERTDKTDEMGTVNLIEKLDPSQKKLLN
jgi:hypothetical protein